MKRFVIRLLVFLSLMFIFDRGFGVAMKYLQDHAKGGYIGHHNYILNQSNEDILIFGSSRAIHHYNPKIIEDSLGMSCYNCGQDGNGIVLFYSWWKLMKDRHIPKIIIYDVNPDFDLLAGDNIKYLGWLRSEYDNDGIKQIFGDIDKTEEYKMQSMMYRYNSKFLQNITDYFHPLFSISSNGYLPLPGELDKMKLQEEGQERKDIHKYDSLKLKYLDMFVKEVKVHNVQLVFVASPVWYGRNGLVFKPILDICERNGARFIDFSNDLKYVHIDVYFKDGNHLNDRGADEFTRNLILLLNKEI